MASDKEEIARRRNAVPGDYKTGDMRYDRGDYRAPRIAEESPNAPGKDQPRRRPVHHRRHPETE